MCLDKGFWQGKKILLTGHTGFKGTWMSLLLESLGANVCGYSLPLNPYSFYHKVSPDIVCHEEGDIADEKRVGSVIESFRPDVLLHFASHSSLDGSMKIPDFILRTNLMGVVNVLEAVRKVDSVKSVVIVTSDKCYQNMETDKPYTEDSPLGAKDPYSTSKVCQELLTECYIDTFFKEADRAIGVATARASNVIGAGDYNISRLMPYLLDSFADNRVPKIRNPHAVRPWQYVLDVLYGYLLLAQKLYISAEITKEYDGAYNFGPGEDGFVTVGQIAKMVSKGFDDAPYEIIKGQDHIKKETNILKLDSTKAQTILHWNYHKTLEETISLTIDFINQEKKGMAAGELCRQQISDYLEAVRQVDNIAG